MHGGRLLDDQSPFQGSYVAIVVSVGPAFPGATGDEFLQSFGDIIRLLIERGIQPDRNDSVLPFSVVPFFVVLFGDIVLIGLQARNFSLRTLSMPHDQHAPRMGDSGGRLFSGPGARFDAF